MQFSFITTLDKVDTYKNKQKILVQHTDTKATIEKYAYSGRLPFHGEQLVLTSSIPLNTLQSYVGKRVRIIATLHHYSDYNYLSTREVSLVEEK